MTYAVRREKVFALQDPQYPDCTPPRVKRSDHRLKNYPSIYDDRTWELSKERQYRALYELISGSRVCLVGGDACHKYVPLEDLIRILMSEKDELIKKLEDELRRCCKNQGGDAGQGEGQTDQIASLTEELNNSREMLRKAMHKLQNINEIVNENKTLQCRLRCSEERIKYLEEKRKCLESELQDLRSKSQIQIDLERTRGMLQEVNRQEPCGTNVDTLTSERDTLQEKVKQLEKELEESKKKEEEIQKLRRGSKEAMDKDEVSMENECFRKKLASMRCLEKQIQDLKKHGIALADKYKREAQKATEQMNRMNQSAKELEALRAERDSLRKRVKELSCYESQYNALQCKLQSVEEVIAENECLNSKMAELAKLEKENEYLKCRLHRIQEMESTAAEDKERIMQLQCAVADQEEEMKDLLCQIKRLTSGTHQEEIERLRCELYEKNSKLKLCEEQLAEIPMLEAEIDELRTKLQSCCRGYTEQKIGKSKCQKIEVRLPAATTGICAKYKLQGQESLIKRKCEERFGSSREDDCSQGNTAGVQKAELSVPCQSDLMTCEEVQDLLQSSKGIISCVLEDMVEHQKEMEELEKRNKAMKEEIEQLKTKIGINPTEAQDENALKKALEEANAEICRLKEAGGSSEDVELLKDLNNQMKAELRAACEGLKKVSLLETKLEEEHRARCKAERQLKKGKEEEGGVLNPDDPNYDCCQALQKEISDLKLQIAELNKLTEELKKENNLLRELNKPCPDFSKELDEKCALENLLSLLQAELDAFKGQKLSDECEALRNELKRVMEQNCQLKALVDCYRQRLDLEKKSKALGEILPDGASEKQKGFAETPSGPIAPSTEYSEGGRAPIATPSSRNIPATEGGRAPIVTPSGRIIPSPEGKEPIVTPSGRIIPATEGGKAPVVKSSERITPSKEDSEGGKAPNVTPSGRIMPATEGGKAPVVTPSGRITPATEGGKAPIVTPSERITPGTEGGKAPIVTPSGRITPGTEGGKAPIVTPSERITPGTEGGKAPIVTPSERSIPRTEDSQGGKAPIVTPTGPTVPAKEDAKPPIVTPSERSTPRKEDSEGGKAPSVTPTGPTMPAKEDAKPPIVTPSVRIMPPAETKEPTVTPSERTIPATESGKAPAVTPSAEGKKPFVTPSGRNLPGADGSEKPPTTTPTERAAIAPDAADKSGGGPGSSAEDDYKACAAELERLRKELADKDEELKAKEAEMKQMEEENAKKLKAVMDQHEKELANRDKAYNNNLNAMKSGYETDIRKLADRHKQSVIKLQGLHEDEVNELNSAYESQMEMMQTQSEVAMKEVAKSSTARLEKLKDQHEQEVKKLRDGLTKSERELETLKKKLETPGPDADALKAKHSREMNAMKRASQRKVSLLKEKFDDEKRKSQSEVENLKKKMKSGVCDCKSRRKERKPKDPCAPLDFIDVIEKILDRGLEALSFNEIALVHRKACCALEEMVMNSDVVLSLEPPVGDYCQHLFLIEADRQQLLRKIFTLQNEIQEKQRRTQETIINMEVAIKRERCRLMELKNLLIDEQRKNSELKMVIQSQSQIQTNLKKEKDELGNKASLHQSLYTEKSKQLDQEKEDKRFLEEEVERLRVSVKQLCLALEMAKEGSACQQNDQLEMLRMRLEQSQNQERKLAFQLQEEAKCRLQLQCQVQALRQSFKQMVNLPAVESHMKIPQNPSEAKSAKEMKNLDQLKEKKNKSKPTKKYKK